MPLKISQSSEKLSLSGNGSGLPKLTQQKQAQLDFVGIGISAAPIEVIERPASRNLLKSRDKLSEPQPRPTLELKPIRKIPSVSNIVNTEYKRPAKMEKKLSSGPRLVTPTVIDKQKIYEESKIRVKEMLERYKLSMAQKEQVEKAIKKKKAEKPSIPDLTAKDGLDKINERLNGNNAIGIAHLIIEKRALTVQNALLKLINLDSDEMFANEVDELQDLMPEIEHELNDIFSSNVNAVLLSSMPKPQRLHPGPEEKFNDDELSSLASKMQRAQSYDKLMSNVQVPKKTLVPIGKRKGASSSANLIIEEDDTVTVVPPEMKFYEDFEYLLQRQMKVENMALSSLSKMDLNIQTKEIAKFPRFQIITLVWNLFIHLKKSKDRLVDLAWIYKATDVMSESVELETEYSQNMKIALGYLSRKQFINLKAIIGHMKSVCSDPINDLKRLTKGMAFLFGTLIFRPPLHTAYTPHIEIRLPSKWPKINFEDRNSFISGGLSNNSSSNDLMSNSNNKNVSFKEAMQILKKANSEPIEMPGIPYVPNEDSLHSIDITSIDDVESSYELFKKAADIDETEESISYGWNVKYEQLESILYEQNLPLSVYSQTVDLLVRFWDFAFATFDAKKSGL
ncbi:hypothetical protein HDV06_000303 [Boothiomyces sp. JEL0866]|nr:hypothetical protein HDV06_000303 [Boothiomyces sp. JEL0866]